MCGAMTRVGVWLFALLVCNLDETHSRAFSNSSIFQSSYYIYEYINTPLKWEHASKYCELRFGSLPDVGNVEDKSIMLDLLATQGVNQQVWINGKLNEASEREGITVGKNVKTSELEYSTQFLTPQFKKDPKALKVMQKIHNRIKQRMRDLLYGELREIRIVLGAQQVGVDKFRALVFLNKTDTKHAKVLNVLPPLPAVTVCMRVQWDNQSSGIATVFSYAVPVFINEFQLRGRIDDIGFIQLALIVHGHHTPYKSVLKSDEQWHHVCVTWQKENGAWSIYADGIKVSSGDGCYSSQTIAGNGIFIIGQDQDSLGGTFKQNEAFSGKITDLNVWTHVLDAKQITAVKMCSFSQQNLISKWNLASLEIEPTVQIMEVQFNCSALKVPSAQCQTFDPISGFKSRFGCENPLSFLCQLKKDTYLKLNKFGSDSRSLFKTKLNEFSNNTMTHGYNLNMLSSAPKQPTVNPFMYKHLPNPYPHLVIAPKSIDLGGGNGETLAYLITEQLKAVAREVQLKLSSKEKRSELIQLLVEHLDLSYLTELLDVKLNHDSKSPPVAKFDLGKLRIQLEFQERDKEHRNLASKFFGLHSPGQLCKLQNIFSLINAEIAFNTEVIMFEISNSERDFLYNSHLILLLSWILLTDHCNFARRLLHLSSFSSDLPLMLQQPSGRAPEGTYQYIDIRVSFRSRDTNLKQDSYHQWNHGKKAKKNLVAEEIYQPTVGGGKLERCLYPVTEYMSLSSAKLVPDISEAETLLETVQHVLSIENATLQPADMLSIIRLLQNVANMEPQVNDTREALENISRSFIDVAGEVLDQHNAEGWTEINEIVQGPMAVVYGVDRMVQNLNKLLTSDQENIVIRSKNIQLEIRHKLLSSFTNGSDVYMSDINNKSADQIGLPKEAIERLQQRGKLPPVMRTSVCVNDILQELSVEWVWTSGSEQKKFDDCQIIRSKLATIFWEPHHDTRLATATLVNTWYGTLYSLLGNGTWDTNGLLETVFDEGFKHVGTQVASAIISSTVFQGGQPVSTPTQYTLQHRVKTVPSLVVDSICVFWNFSLRPEKGGGWSTDGCRVVKPELESTTCFCKHTTNFALLFQLYEVKRSSHEEAVLMNLTLIGCTISLCALVITLILFSVVGVPKSDRTTVHKNLICALVAAEALLIASDSAKTNQVACSVVTAMLHLFFMAAFAWMLVEGILLWSKVVTVNISEERRMKYYYLIGWGFPVFIVAITLATAGDKYIADNHCWLNVQSEIIWTFVGPVLFTLTVNTFVLCRVVVITIASSQRRSMMLASDSGLAKRVSSQIWAAIKPVVILLPVLGLTWFCGVLVHLNIALAYIFVVLNSFQGLYIFLVYAVYNSEVRNAIKRMKEQRKALSFTNCTSSRPSSCLASPKMTTPLDVGKRISAPDKGTSKPSTNKSAFNEGKAAIFNGEIGAEGTMCFSASLTPDKTEVQLTAFRVSEPADDQDIGKRAEIKILRPLHYLVPSSPVVPGRITRYRLFPHHTADYQLWRLITTSSREQRNGKPANHDASHNNA
ncbi:uncharacterized protein LOC121281538 [Carcharodon carcharias]|uniref:uncharacterized protein LOC121281538 n=1 Tax=Carcharodon carcharias TaxID=13397 RepID=UPI001B7E76CD|nr:uncharacterized protein LOC121281538 [Carcharodon carcharias]